MLTKDIQGMISEALLLQNAPPTNKKYTKPLIAFCAVSLAVGVALVSFNGALSASKAPEVGLQSLYNHSPTQLEAVIPVSVEIPSGDSVTIVDESSITIKFTATGEECGLQGKEGWSCTGKDAFTVAVGDLSGKNPYELTEDGEVTRLVYPNGDILRLSREGLIAYYDAQSKALWLHREDTSTRQTLFANETLCITYLDQDNTTCSQATD